MRLNAFLDRARANNLTITVHFTPPGVMPRSVPRDSTSATCANQVGAWLTGSDSGVSDKAN